MKDGSYELNRFCVKSSIAVVGVASKIFKTFLNEYNPTKVISYANCRWSYGDLYKSLKFDFIKMSPPCAWYTQDFKTIKHRASLMKHKLPNIEKHESTSEARQSLGYYAIYDCGNTVWSYEKNHT